MLFSLAEVSFAELHNLSKNAMQTLWASFQMNFPHTMEIILGVEEFRRMEADVTKELGAAHPETNTAFVSSNCSWALYSPRTTFMVRGASLYQGAWVGFKDQLDAMAFKLKWYQN